MPVPTLLALAKQRLIQNISMLTDIGDLPYSMLAPVLARVENPAQLQELEENCPQLKGETGDIWMRFIARDIPKYDEIPHKPRDPKKWSNVYRKLKRDAEREKLEQEEKLKEQMRAMQRDRKNNTTTIVDGKTGFDPAARRRGYGGKPISSGWGSSSAPAKTGRAGLDKLRKSMFDQKQARPKNAMMPTHVLEERRGKVHSAPERLIRINEAQAQAPKRMLVPQRIPTDESSTAANPASRVRSAPSRPPPQTSPKKCVPQMVSLPKDQQFSVPRLQNQNASATPPPPPQKRKRQDANPFMTKKRKV